MQLIFLGTSAGKPSSFRNVSSLALDLRDESGEVWLFDCGEATQHQMIKKIKQDDNRTITVSPSKINKIFITHLHGDHIFGLFGFLTTRSMNGCNTPLTIFSPKGLKALIELAIETTQSYLNFELEIIELTLSTNKNEPFLVYESPTFKITGIELKHRIQSFAYRIEEFDKTGSLNINKLRKIGINNQDYFKKLKKGEDIPLENGSILLAKDYLAPSIKGKTIVIFGDTEPCENEVIIAKDADYVVHEATLENALQDIANERGHSTTVQTAKMAKKANVQNLIITHLSSRYTKQNEDSFLEECKTIFPRTYLAHDFETFKL